MLTWHTIQYVILHLICGILAAGILCADTQEKFYMLEEYRLDLGFSLFLGLIFGPMALLVILFFTGFAQHGCSFKKKEK